MSGTGFELGFLGTATGSQAYVRRGPREGPQLLVIQPLFEERNRLRRFLAAATRHLAEAGIGSWMFDLPCTGDDSGSTIDATWSAWSDSVGEHAAHAGPDLHILSVRGGALLDGLPARSHYRLAPVAGERLLRELMRSRVAGQDGMTMAMLEAQLARSGPIEVGGFQISAGLAAALRAVVPSPVTPLRIAVVGDSPGDIVLPGAPLWRQAEPVDEPAFAQALAADLIDWMASCGRR